MIKTESIITRYDMIHCALCKDAPCAPACEHIDPSSVLRSIWFKNEQIAALRLPDKNPCMGCEAPCEKACVRHGEVPIRDLIDRLYTKVRPECETDIPKDESRLSCDMCGIQLDSPFLLSSSVVASTYDMCARAFEAGWAGACFKTICSLDIREASPRYSAIHGNDRTIAGFKKYRAVI